MIVLKYNLIMLMYSSFYPRNAVLISSGAQLSLVQDLGWQFLQQCIATNHCPIKPI